MPASAVDRNSSGSPVASIKAGGLGFAHDCHLADLVHNAKICLWNGELAEVERILNQITKRLGREV